MKTKVLMPLLFSGIAFASSITMLFPKTHATLFAGKTYTLQWQTNLKGKVCIKPVIGNKVYPSINHCHTTLQAKKVTWKVPSNVTKKDKLSFIFEKHKCCNLLYQSPTYFVEKSKKPFFILLFPYPHARLFEGKTYTIKWKTNKQNKICITALIGGHERSPHMNDCKTKALSGSYVWHIPKGFVSDFGPTSSCDVWLGFSNAKDDFIFYRSKPFCVYSKAPKPLAK